MLIDRVLRCGIAVTLVARKLKNECLRVVLEWEPAIWVSQGIRFRAACDVG